jgi:hypothetical protein
MTEDSLEVGQNLVVAGDVICDFSHGLFFMIK